MLEIIDIQQLTIHIFETNRYLLIIINKSGKLATKYNIPQTNKLIIYDYKRKKSIDRKSLQATSPYI